MLLKHRDFYHQNIHYSFNWNIKNHKEKLNQLNSTREEFKRIGVFLKKILQGSIPDDLFNRKDISRVSQFKIKGLRNGFLTSFSKKLIRSGKIKKFNSTPKLSKCAQKVYEIYKKNKFGKKPGHDTILKNILIKDSDSIAIEVPIWNDLNNEYLTGHIDLIQIENNVVKVIDYKPEGKFLYSLPQVATYGLLFKNQLKINRLKCVSFNRNQAWEYDPYILLTDIKQYLISQGIKNRTWEYFLENKLI